MLDLVRDSTFGQIVNWASKGRLLPYADQRSDYVVPARYLSRQNASPLPLPVSQAPTLESGAVTLVDESGVCAEKKQLGSDAGDIEKQAQPDSGAVEPPSARYPWLVDFDENDPDRPLNWSSRKRLFVAGLVSLLTFSVYVGSAIYTSSIPGIMEEFGIGQVGATAGLTLFVAAYGMAPNASLASSSPFSLVELTLLPRAVVLSPMQEIPRWGRLPVYIIGLALFVIFQIPQVLAENVATVLVFRFLSGAVGSPALATGGASMGDIYPPKQLAIAIGAWSMGAVCGPIAGPVIGGFAAQGMNWRWPLLELLWISGFAFVVLFFTFPETLESTILIRRAERLRKLTGNTMLKAPAEVDVGEDDKLGHLLKETISRAFRLAVEPSLAVCHLYIALVYAVFYLWFEAFPLTFNEIHHFSLGTGGLPYLTFVVSAAITFPAYCLYQKYHLNPRMERDPNLKPEARLEIALIAAPFIPASLLIFGWTARESVHWMAPVVGAGLYLPGIFLAFQGIMVYVTMSYPKYAASNLAANDLFRSTIASAFPLFGARYFTVLGIGPGSTLLAGVSMLMMPLLWVPHIKYGPVLRARSKFAQG
ncbi:hypothetical protein JCM8208_005531 [Rhodotorula glutinis]